MTTMLEVLHALKQQRTRLDNAITALEGGKKPMQRHLSRAARKAISDAQRKRWAERRKPPQGVKAA